MYTLIKIDEVNNLGAIRIRIRSLLASMNKRIKNKQELESKKTDNGDYNIHKIPFTKEMKKEYTIIIPHYIVIVPKREPLEFDISLILDVILSSSCCLSNCLEEGDECSHL